MLTSLMELDDFKNAFKNDRCDRFKLFYSQINLYG
jgi:hypothetical protein